MEGLKGLYDACDSFSSHYDDEWIDAHNVKGPRRDVVRAYAKGRVDAYDQIMRLINNLENQQIDNMVRWFMTMERNRV
jgi:hypothetical protein